MKEISVFKELRSFLLLWSSQAVSELGTAMVNFALIIWIHEQQGTVSSVTLLTLCSFLPTILFRFVAGALADAWNKKRIMLLADALAACGTGVIWLLFSKDALQIGHIYVINVLLSFMNAFQVPAAYTATSLLVPQKHYSRAGGLQGFSGAAISILSPALGGVLLAVGGLDAVLLFDLVSFSIALLVLLFFIKIPEQKQKLKAQREPFISRLTDGIHYLKGNKALLHLILCMTIVNFLAKLGGDGMLSPFVLSKTGNNEQVLGLVQSFVAVGLLAGSLIMTLMQPAKNKIRTVFITLTLTFSGNVLLGLTHRPWLWCVGNFISYLFAAIMNAHLSAIMREQVPIEMQGRVFSARDTLQNGAIPLGLFLGGVLADHVFEPFIAAPSPLQKMLLPLFGMGKGAGISLMFFLVGVVGMTFCATRLLKPVYKPLAEEQKN